MRQKGDVDAVTNTIIISSSHSQSECVNNKITFSADEWRENVIKECRKPFKVIYSDTLFIVYCTAASPRCQINHKTVSFNMCILSPVIHIAS